MEKPQSRKHFHPLLWAGIAMLLAVPLVAMQVTSEVQWTAFDFTMAALLLALPALAFELASMFVEQRSVRIVLVTGFVLASLVLWAQGAVGLL